MKIFLQPNPHKDPRYTVTGQAIRVLQRYGGKVLLAQQLSEKKIPDVEYLPEEDAFEQADAILTVGGDGTILHTAKGCLKSGKPILGINVGRTGFLATCEINELEVKLPRLLNGNFKVEERGLLEARVDETVIATAINDVVVYNNNRCQAMDFSIFCDGILVSDNRGDGVILATPTGSTGYALSAGGPVLDSSIDGFVVQTICAHSLKSPAVVFSAERHITICARQTESVRAVVCSDGVELMPLGPDQKLEVRYSPQRLKLISFSNAEQFDAIDNKLRGR